LVVGLVDRGLVKIMYERVRAGGTIIDATKVRVTVEGRRALIELAPGTLPRP